MPNEIRKGDLVVFAGTQQPIGIVINERVNLNRNLSTGNPYMFVKQYGIRVLWNTPFDGKSIGEVRADLLEKINK